MIEFVVETPRGQERFTGNFLGVLGGHLLQPKFGGYTVAWGDTFERAWAPGSWWSFRIVSADES